MSQSGGNCHRCGKYITGDKEGKVYHKKNCNPQGTYKDTPQNRKLGRVGKVYRSSKKVKRTSCRKPSRKSSRKSSRNSSRKSSRKRCKRGSRRSSTKKTCRHKHKKCKRGSRYSKSSKRCKKNRKSSRKRCKKGSRRSSTKKTCRHKHKKCKRGSRYSKSSKKCKPTKGKPTKGKPTKSKPVKPTKPVKPSKPVKSVKPSKELTFLDQLEILLLGPYESGDDAAIVEHDNIDELHNAIIDQNEDEFIAEENIDDECEDELYGIHCKNKPSMCVPMWVNEKGDEREYPIDNFCNYTNDDILRRMESTENLRDIYKEHRNAKGKFVGHRKSKSYKKNKKPNKDKGKKPCPPGQKRNSRTGRCRKTKSKK